MLHHDLIVFFFGRDLIGPDNHNAFISSVLRY